MKDLDLEKFDELIQTSQNDPNNDGHVRIKINDLKTLLERVFSERERIEQASRFEIERLASLFESIPSGFADGAELAEEIRSLQPIHYSVNNKDRLFKLILWCRPRLSKDEYRATLDEYLTSDISHQGENSTEKLLHSNLD